MSRIAVSPLPKLPLGETIGLSYAWFFQKFADVLRVSWLWLVLGTVLFGILNGLQWSWIATAIASGPKGVAQIVQPQAPSGLSFLITLAYLVMMLGTTSIAVAWHRRIILGEQPELSGSNIVTKPFWRYIGVGIAIMLICILPIVIVMVPAVVLLAPIKGTTWKLSGGITLFLIIVALYVVVLAIMLRLSVLLPARAAGDRSLTFGRAWQRTRGNTWRMFWGMLACSVPPIIVIEIVSLVLMAAIGAPRLAPTNGLVTIPVVSLTIISTLLFVVTLLIVPIYIGFLSHTYRYFFQDVTEVFE